MQDSDYPFMPPSSTCVSEDLLFFDTFSHSNADKCNFDLVQFPSPVIIDFIKVVPLGQPVEANIPGNVRLGATNPSNCELEFFINDLTKQDAHTMADLGKFYCNEKDTNFSSPLQIQTDGLLLRGNYRTLTLAIFGQIVAYDEKPDDEPAMLMSATSPPAQTPASPLASERDLPYIVGNVDQELIRRDRKGEESLEESTIRSGELSKDNQIFDHVNDIDEENAIMDLVQNETENPKEPEDSEDLSKKSNDSQNVFDFRRLDDTENSNSCDLDQPVKTKAIIEQDLNVSSAHILSQRSEVRTRTEKTDLDNKKQLVGEDFNPDAQEWTFDPDTYSFKPLHYFPDPSLTLQEKTLEAHKLAQIKQQDYLEIISKEVDKVKEMFDVLGCSSDSKTEDWVTLVEDLTNDLSNMSLSHIINSDSMLNFLVEQVLHGTDLTLALKQRQTGFKVRHLKAGIKLATILFHCGQTAVSVMLDAGVLHRVLNLFNQDQMSMPLKLLIFRCLNAACDTVAGVEHIINQVYDWNDTDLTLKRLRQISFNTRNQDEADNIYEFNQNTSLTCYQYMLLILMSKPTTRVMIAVGNLIKKIRLFTKLSKVTAFNSVKIQAQDNIEDSVFENDRREEEVRLEKCLEILQDIVHLLDENCSNIAQPLRHLPASAQFHVKPCPNDTLIAVYKWFKHFRVIQCIDSIIVQTRTPMTIDLELSIKIRSLCLKLIQRLLDSHKGSQFMLSQDCYHSTRSLLKSLAFKFEPTRLRMTGMESLPDASLCRGVSLSFAACRDQSLRMGYHLKVMSCIDKLFEFHRQLLSRNSNESSKTTCDPEKVLHQLYIMSDHPYGLAAIMKHFSCIGNLDCILRFLDMSDYQKHLEFVRETLIDYVLELVGTFLRLNNNVLEIAEEYLDTLIDLSKTKEKALTTRIKSLLPWLTPFEVDQPFPLITYSEETFRQLTRIIRKSIPDRTIPFAKGLNFELPPQLITSVRILRQLCISPQVENFIESTFDVFSPQHLSSINEQTRSTSLPFVGSLPRQQNHNQSWNLASQEGQDQLIGMNLHDDSLVDHVTQLNILSKLFQPYDESICGDLKYHYGIMQVFEQEDLRRLLNTLRELTGNYPRPLYQSAALSGQRGRIVISYIHSVVVLLHSIACHLIDARGKEFKDTSIISVILETYSLLCFAPKPSKVRTLTDVLTSGDLAALQSSITIKSDNYRLAQQTKKLILSILMSHTQMCLSVSESEENVISKSMWTKMLREVIDFTLSTPVYFHHGLDVITKILPPPLPHPSILDTVDQEQLFKNFNHRKLWSAHLHPLHHKIEFMISSFSLCCQGEIRTLLCYFCNQLCDLSSNTACMVVNIIVDSLIVCVNKLSNDSNGDLTLETTDSQIVVSGAKDSKFAIIMIVNLLSNLISNQAFNTAFVNNLQAMCKKDEKFLNQLQSIIRTHENFKPKSLELNESNVGDSANATITNIIESIKNISSSGDADGGRMPESLSVVPPEELTKIDLIDLARKTTDRFNLPSGIAKTYRLKILLDMNARAHRANEPSSKRFDRSTPSYSYKELMASANHKAYATPMRGRSRPPLRPDSFRSRPQNTSRPPSIHVDDFVDIYGENPSQGANGGPSGRYWPKPPMGHFGGPSDGGGGRAHSKSKHMKLK